MQLTYDPEFNIAYIRLKKTAGKVRSIIVSDELTVDLAADGSVYGMELLNANVQLQSSRKKVISMVNKSTGAKCDLPLAG